MVKVYVIPLETLQLNLLQQVLKKIPVKPLCRIRRTCKFFDFHIEEYKNTFASRSFDSEMDLLWSNSISRPDLTFSGPNDRIGLDFMMFKWGTYQENVDWDSHLEDDIFWRESCMDLDGFDAGKLSAVTFGTVDISNFDEVIHKMQAAHINAVKSLSLHCETLDLVNISLDDVKSLADAIHCKTIIVSVENIDGENNDWEDYVGQLAMSEFCSKIQLELTLVPDANTDREWAKKFGGLTLSGKDREFKTFLQDLYTTTESYNLEHLCFDIIWEANEEPNLTLDVPHETLWERDSLPARHRKPLVPRFIHLVQLPGKQAVVTIYENQAKEVNIDIIKESQESVLKAVKRALHILDSRREEEYLCADVNEKREILREQFLASRR